jgi:uncharacterized protein
MRILLSVEHPAWAHQFRYLIRALEDKGHIIKVVAINKDRDLELLDIFGIPYEIISHSSGNTTFQKAWIFCRTTLKIWLIARKFDPDLFFGRASPMMAINSFLHRKPHIVFEDTEPASFSLEICKLFSCVILTPRHFNKDLGRKHIRIDTFKELFYLHPHYFHPDPTILDDLKINPDERYLVFRFVSMTAHHDFGHHGILDPVKFVLTMNKYAKIFITSEKTLPKELEQYQLTTSFEKIHEVLYFSSLFISDSGTMTTEASVLGIPAIWCNSFVGTYAMGNFIELENDYGMIFCFRDQTSAEEKAIAWVHHPGLKEEWRVKRERLLKDKIDATKFFTWFIEQFPESITLTRTGSYHEEENEKG